MKTNDASIPELVKAEVLKIDPRAEVFLFGSRARGDFNSESDWDFLILLSKPVNFVTQKLIWDRLYDIELESEQMITSLIEEKSEWRKYSEAPIYENIERQGITIS